MLILGAAAAKTHESSLLSELAHQTGGTWLQRLIGIDAVLVLSGTVLTSYVGVTGLIRRMTLDRCLPQFLLKENNWRKTNHWIILGFFSLSCVIYFVTQGSVSSLAGVYALSFLSVMALFSVGNLLLKKSRARLPRSEIAKIPAVVISLFAVLIALLFNLNPTNVEHFLLFFLFLGGAITVMFSRVLLLRLGLFTLKHLVDKFAWVSKGLQNLLYTAVDQVNSQSVIYFSKGDNLPTLNHAALYVLENEQTNNLIVVHISEDTEKIPPNLANQLKTIDQLYPELRIDFLAVKGRFSPQTVEKISKRLNIPKNCMFIGTPGENFKHSLAELGGVRIIL